MLHRQGLRYMAEEKWNLAVDQLEKSIAAKNDDWLVWVDYGDALCIDARGIRYGSPDRNERAAAAYRKAAEINPGAARAWNNLAWLRARTVTSLDEALTAAKRAVDIDPERTGYLDTLAEVFFARGEHALALDAMKKALAIEPSDEYLRRQLTRFENALAAATPTPAPKGKKKKSR